METPNWETDRTVTPSPHHPIGAKGVGESGTLPVAAVVASAVEDALSDRRVVIDRMPITPRALRRLLYLERADR